VVGAMGKSMHAVRGHGLLARDEAQNGGAPVSVTPDCTKECERVVECVVCKRRKPPIGRDVSPYMFGSYCEHECPGRNAEPRGGHLWPGELERSKEQDDE